MIASTQTNHPLAGVGQAPKASTLVAQACTQLKTAGLRITQPRIAILTALIKRGQPASIDQLHSDLSGESCDLVTVYRCLAAFEEIGLVRRSFFHNGTSLYEINLGGVNRYHVVCKNTKRVEEIDSADTAELRLAVQKVEELLKARGFTEVTHMVEFFAVAPTRASIAHTVPATPTH